MKCFSAPRSKSNSPNFWRFQLGIFFRIFRRIENFIFQVRKPENLSPRRWSHVPEYHFDESAAGWKNFYFITKQFFVIRIFLLRKFVNFNFSALRDDHRGDLHVLLL